jgi:hypothetical protein
MQGSYRKPKLGKRVFLALRFGAPMPMRYFEWRLALDTGWTLDYIRSLPYGDIVEYLEITDAINKAKNT